MRIFVADIETNRLIENGKVPDKIHLFGWKDLSTGEVTTLRDYHEIAGAFKPVTPDKWVFHNGLAFDVPVLNAHHPGLIDPRKVVDTMVVSKLVNYRKFSTHSLKELGEHLKVHKGDYEGEWDTRTEDMEEYWLQDLEVGEAVWNYLKPHIMDPAWSKAMRAEHDMATICHDMHCNGFSFAKEMAQDILKDVEADMEVLEDGFQSAFPPVRTEEKRLKARKKLIRHKDGTTEEGDWYSNVQRALDEYGTDCELEYPEDGGAPELVCYKYEPFSPASPKKRIDALWDAGWKPYVKTKGHNKFLREQRHGHYD